MVSRKHFEIAISTLILLALVLPPHAEAFTSNQSAVIAIGQWKSPSYGELDSQGGLAFDLSGNLWVADTFNNRILGFTPPFSGNMSASFVVGQQDFQGTGSGIGRNAMGRPTGVASDTNGNFWVADPDNNRVLAFHPPFHNGMNASVVIGQTDFSSNASATTRNALSWPNWVALDAAGNLWIADSSNSRVLEFQPPFSTGMNASLVLGEPDFTHNYCNPWAIGYNGICGSDRILNVPSQIAFDPSGDLWVAEGVGPTGRLLEFKPPFMNGMLASLRFEPVFPSTLAIDQSGDLWLGCYLCGVGVFEYRPPFNQHSIVWENGVPRNPSLILGGFPGERSDLPLTPTGLAFDSAGNLWVVDFRGTWLIGLLGRVLGFDAKVHSVDTVSGIVSFENHDGLLVPLSSIPLTQEYASAFLEGLFNFTIQGLPAGGSATVTVSFPHALAPGMDWWSRQGNQWKRLPAIQTQVEGNNMTLLFTHVSLDGVISEVGGPAEAPPNVTAYTETTSINTFSSQNESATTPTLPASTLTSVALAIAVVSMVAFYWKHKREQTSPKSVR